MVSLFVSQKCSTYNVRLQSQRSYTVREQLAVFYCDVWPEGLPYDAECDLLAIAAFLVVSTTHLPSFVLLTRFYWFSFTNTQDTHVENNTSGRYRG